MLKVRLNCPICGDLMLAKSLEGHLENVHELTGTVLLRLNPTHPYAHEPEEAEAEGPAEPEPAVEPEPEQPTEPAEPAEPAPEETPRLDELEAR